jgi:hypothetical protein
MQTKKIIWVGKPEKIGHNGMYAVPYEYRDEFGTGFSRQVCDDYHQADYFYNSHIENDVKY